MAATSQEVEMFKATKWTAVQLDGSDVIEPKLLGEFLRMSAKLKKTKFVVVLNTSGDTLLRQLVWCGVLLASTEDGDVNDDDFIEQGLSRRPQ